MTTIYTDDLAHGAFDICIDEPSIGYKGRNLILTGPNSEFRVNLTDEQLTYLAEVLLLNGYEPKQIR